MLKKLYGKLESSINALESWLKERKNLVGLLVGIVILGGSVKYFSQNGLQGLA